MKSPVTSCFVIKKRGATYVTPPIVFFPNLNQDTVTKILHLQSPNQKIPDRKTKCVIKTHINIKQNVIFGAKLKPV